MKFLHNKLFQFLCFLIILGLVAFNYFLFKRSNPAPILPSKSISEISLQETPTLPNKILTFLENSLQQRGLSNITEIDSSILVDLKYSTEDNFMEQNAYGNFMNCYLQGPAAKKLGEAQKYLSELEPNYRLMVLDCCRPRSVQQKMWTIVKNTPEQRYVAPPNYGSQHNYGVAVDLTIADENGRPLDMGTKFDFFGPLAEPRHEAQFLQEGKLNQEQVKNRQLLRTVMKKAGFRGIAREWWHFEAFSREYTRNHFEIVE